LKDNLTQEQLINLEKLLVKEIRKRTGHSKEIKKALFILYPIMHPCCLLREVRGRIKPKAIEERETPNNQLELAKYISQELSNQHKSKEEKTQEIVNFCLDYLNQGVKENWKKKRNKSLMLLTLAENE
jgi:hypothetical protein